MKKPKGLTHIPKQVVLRKNVKKAKKGDLVVGRTYYVSIFRPKRGRKAEQRVVRSRYKPRTNIYIPGANKVHIRHGESKEEYERYKKYLKWMVDQGWVWIIDQE